MQVIIVSFVAMAIAAAVLICVLFGKVRTK